MEAMDHTVPLFDRIKFLSIYQSNQEEFYRVRVSEYHKYYLIHCKASRINDRPKIH